MDRDFPFNPDEICDDCGRLGAYDFYGDYLCEECVKEYVEENEDV